MRIPIVRGVIDRRILINFRVQPKILQEIVPPPFRPVVYQGAGMAGICLIRLQQIRPRYLPAFFGFASENAAHRIAVEWDENGVIKEGVFIPRRDTSSRLNSLLGGRVFPGKHNHAKFDVRESQDHFRVELMSDDGGTQILVNSELAETLPSNSVFDSVEQASRFFERGALGYSVTESPDQFDGVELHPFNWEVQPLDVSEIRSSYFEDQTLFPAGSIEFDSALLMRRIEHEWRGLKTIRACQCCVGT